MSAKPSPIAKLATQAAMFSVSFSLANWLTGNPQVATQLGAFTTFGLSAIADFLKSLAPNLITNLLGSSAEAREAAQRFALNDTIARPLGRSAGQLVKDLATASATYDKDTKKKLLALADGFEELWVQVLERDLAGAFRSLDGQELAHNFAQAVSSGASFTLDRDTWQLVVARKGSPLVDDMGRHLVPKTVIDDVLDRLASADLPAAMLQQLAFDKEAGMKMVLRLLPELLAMKKASAGLSAEDRTVLDGAAFKLDTQLSLLQSVDQKLDILRSETRDGFRKLSSEHIEKEALRILERQCRPSVVIPTKLPYSHRARRFFGRERAQRWLLGLWERPEMNVVCLVGWGGEGKTALAAEFRTAMEPRLREHEKPHGGAVDVFDWSFYSQGTRDQGNVASDPFIIAALIALVPDGSIAGHPSTRVFAEGPTLINTKAEALLRHLQQRRTLLILDGLEPMQYPPRQSRHEGGLLKDDAMRYLLDGLSEHNPGLCLLTTRVSIANLNPRKRMRRGKGAPVREHRLRHLSTSSGAKLLHHLGVTRAGSGSIQAEDKELRAAVREVRGHALTLRLLGHYLVLTSADGRHGDIRQRNDLRLAEAEHEFKTNIQDESAGARHGHAFKMLAAYERLFASSPQDALPLALLRVLGLFDRAATPDCIAALSQAPAIPGLTEPLVNAKRLDWNKALTTLENLDLIEQLTPPPNHQSKIIHHKSIDAHPLVREFFDQRLVDEHQARLEAKQPSCYQAAHRSLYEHLRDNTHEPKQPSLTDLQPLFQAVVHGCKGGLHQEACHAVYTRRILKGGEYYAVDKLGAIGPDLGAVACFFEAQVPQTWDRPMATLTKGDQAWMLNNAASRLRALGRLTEARGPFRSAMEAYVRMNMPQDSAVCASNLSELELTLAEVAEAVATGEQSVTYADQSKDEFQMMARRTTHADALHQAGKREQAQGLFAEAEEMQKRDELGYDFLYSLGGYRYCDLLLGQVECLMWREAFGVWRQAQRDAAFAAATDSFPTPDPVTPGTDGERMPLLRSASPSGNESDRDRGVPGSGESGVALSLATALQTLRDVRQRAEKALVISTRNNWLLSIALDHLTLARVDLYTAMLSTAASPPIPSPPHEVDAPPPPPEVIARLTAQAEDALIRLRAAGTMDHLPRALLHHALTCGFAALCFVQQGDTHGAARAQDAARTSLDEVTDIALRGGMRLFLADAHLHRARIFQDREALESARKLITECGYGRRAEELADADLAAKQWPDTPAK